ncbi:MAG: hypothetical protein LBP24_00955, partial [Coriobacteriales bacterium]|nr:hypothetical protein [Coriobacteriales bacterium]
MAPGRRRGGAFWGPHPQGRGGAPAPFPLLGVDNRNVPLSTSSSPEAEGSGGLSGAITGWGAAGPRPPGGPLDCGNSGTTARLLLGILSGHDIAVSLAGDESLSRRPMSRVTLPLTQMGARFSPVSVPGRSSSGRSSDTLPLTVHGTAALRAIDYQSPV